MTSTGTLGERKADVLRAVVDDHIRSGEPVGSGTVARRYRLGVSAANIVSEATFQRRETVRRLLEALEEEEAVLSLLRALARERDVVVRIGGEIPVMAMREASVVVSAYGTGGSR